MLFSRRVVCDNVTQGRNTGHQTRLIGGDENCLRWADQRTVFFRRGGKEAFVQNIVLRQESRYVAVQVPVSSQFVEKTET